MTVHMKLHSDTRRANLYSSETFSSMSNKGRRTPDLIRVPYLSGFRTTTIRMTHANDDDTTHNVILSWPSLIVPIPSQLTTAFSSSKLSPVSNRYTSGVETLQMGQWQTKRWQRHSHRICYSHRRSKSSIYTNAAHTLCSLCGACYHDPRHARLQEMYSAQSCLLNPLPFYRVLTIPSHLYLVSTLIFHRAY